MAEPVFKNKKMKSLLTEVLDALKACYGPRLVKTILYGSQARGDAEAGSDIDLLVVLQGAVNPVEEGDRLLDKIVTWNLEYQELVSLLFMDETRFESEKSPLLLNIRREGISI